MILIAKQGRNQKGLCFVPADEPSCEPGVYELKFRERRLLADIRKSAQVSDRMIILDSRVFAMMNCDDGSEISLTRICDDLPICRELGLAVASKKSLDNTAVASAISKRVNDLQEDFDGLLLTKNQRILLERLGVQFTVDFLKPVDDGNNSCRLRWSSLEKIHLDPAIEAPAYNLICVIELGAAAHIADIRQSSVDGDSTSVPRYFAAIELLHQVELGYCGYGTDAKFSGIVYSDEITTYPMFDSETGEPVEISSFHSESILDSFRRWIREVAPAHSRKSSNPGAALGTAFERALSMPSSTEHPTIVALFSSGTHSSGPNPLKIVKKKGENKSVPVVCFCLGEDSNRDVMKAIAEYTKGIAVEITDMGQVNMVNEWLLEWFRDRS